jgi:hypothetical protein
MYTDALFKDSSVSPATMNEVYAIPIIVPENILKRSRRPSMNIAEY